MKENIQTAKANWRVSLDVDCPYCDHYFDVLHEGYFEGLPQVCETDENLEIEVECPRCATVFILEKTEY